MLFIYLAIWIRPNLPARLFYCIFWNYSTYTLIFGIKSSFGFATIWQYLTFSPNFVFTCFWITGCFFTSSCLSWPYQIIPGSTMHWRQVDISHCMMEWRVCEHTTKNVYCINVRAYCQLRCVFKFENLLWCYLYQEGWGVSVFRRYCYTNKIQKSVLNREKKIYKMQRIFSTIVIVLTSILCIGKS